MSRPAGLDALPDDALDPAAALGGAFVRRGCIRFRDAARLVHALPYGRNTDRADLRLVLPEGCGTCSTKHALLAALAAESGVEVHLALGIFLLDGRNTPGAGPPLAAAGLAAVPEAHTFLVSGGVRVDLTWPGRASIPPPVVWEETIRPDQIGAYKVARHQAYIAAWAAERRLDPGDVWDAREACIRALARAAAPS